MSKSPSPPSQSSLMSIDIAGVVSQAKEKDLVEPSSPQEEVHVSSSDAENSPSHAEISSSHVEEPPIHSAQWSSFLGYLKYFKGRKGNKSRHRTIAIEDNIIDVIENCNIKNSSVPNVINAALRSFIEEHKEQLRESLKPRPTLILD